jgi:hypothetical protein
MLDIYIRISNEELAYQHTSCSISLTALLHTRPYHAKPQYNKAGGSIYTGNIYVTNFARVFAA